MALQQLTTALESLSQSVSDFNVGAVSIADFKPLENQLEDLRQILKVQKAHSFLINAKQNSQPVADKIQEDLGTSISILQGDISQLQITSRAINLCLQSCASSDIMVQEKPQREYKKQVQGCMRRLFLLYDNLISIETARIQALETEMRLKIEGPEVLLKYREFLKEQEDLRDKKLQETNPQVLKNKKKLESKLMKINIMKRLMTNMIAAAGNIISEDRFLFEMMKKHRELINIETIIEMGRELESSDTS